MSQCHECRCFLSPPCNNCVGCSHIDLDAVTRGDCDYTCQTCPYDVDNHPEVVLAGMTPETHPDGDATPMIECPECHGHTGPSMITRSSGYVYSECGTCKGVGAVQNIGTSRSPESILEEMTVIIRDTLMVGHDGARQTAMQLMQFVHVPEPDDAYNIDKPGHASGLVPSTGATSHFYIHTDGRIDQLAPIDSRGIDEYFGYPRAVRGGIRYPSPPGVGQPPVRNNVIY